MKRATEINDERTSINFHNRILLLLRNYCASAGKYLRVFRNACVNNNYHIVRDPASFAYFRQIVGFA